MIRGIHRGVARCDCRPWSASKKKKVPQGGFQWEWGHLQAHEVSGGSFEPWVFSSSSEAHPRRLWWGHPPCTGRFRPWRPAMRIFSVQPITVVCTQHSTRKGHASKGAQARRRRVCNSTRERRSKDIDFRRTQPRGSKPCQDGAPSPRIAL